MGHGNNGRGLGTLVAPQRNNYFYGKLMDVAHFQMEQGYVNRKRWLLNRVGLGEGVLCGLDVTPKDGQICVTPGVAIDALGREIIVPATMCLDPWQLTDESGRPSKDKLSDTEEQTVHLCLAYNECAADYMPVLVTDCNTREECSPGTIVESFRLLVRDARTWKPTDLSGLPKEDVCKALTGGAAPAEKRRLLCNALSSDECQSKQEESCILLATVTLEAEHKIGEVKVCFNRPRIYSNATLLDLILCLSQSRGGGQGTGVNSADAVTGSPVSATFNPTNGNIHFVIPPGQAGADGVSVRSADVVAGTPLSATFNPTNGNIHFVIPPGQAGADGVSVRSATAQTGTPVSATFDAATGNIDFVIPKGDKGDPGTGLIPDLTKVMKTDPWTHDGLLNITAFMQGLAVGFTRGITPTTTTGRAWFLVSVEYPVTSAVLQPWGPPGTILIHRVLDETITTTTNTALFKPHASFRQTFTDTMTKLGAEQALCRVILKCDFLLDEERRVVDGNHLKGTLFSGDGVPGGDFESWFVLTM